MTKFHIDQGTEGNLPTSGMAEEGHLYVTSDKGNAYFALSDNGNIVPLNRSPYYLTCATAAGTAPKSATMPDGEPLPSTLRAGIFVVVKFAASNTATSPSLKITDGFGRIYGPIAIKKYGTTAVGNNASVSWSANEAVAFLYDGEYFLMLNHIPLLATTLVDGLMSSSDFKKINAQSITATDSAKADLNDYKTVGTYITSGGPNGSSVQQNTLNTPTGSAGAFMLVVLRTSSDNSITLRKQIYIQANGMIWSREYNSSTWSTWQQWELSQVQSNWEEDDDDSKAYVQLRPNVRRGTAATAVVEGNIVSNIASGSYSHSEGGETKAAGSWSHTEGRYTKAYSPYAHAEGYGVTASGDSAHAEGFHNPDSTSDGDISIEGVTGTGEQSASSTFSYTATSTEGLEVGDVLRSEVNGVMRHAVVRQVQSSTAFTAYSTLGVLSNATITRVRGVAMTNAHCEGRATVASGNRSHAEGYMTKAFGTNAHAEGNACKTMSNHCHAEGDSTKASNAAAHAEGNGTTASGAASHAEGIGTTASGAYSHTEGNGTTASSYSAHAEGWSTTASGGSSTYQGAHAEGMNTTASGPVSHAEGFHTTAGAFGSHTEGCYTQTTSGNNYEHAQGKYNASHKKSSTWGDAGNTLHSIGIGTSDSNRKNAVEVMQNGDVYIDRVGNYNGSGGVMPLQDVIGAMASDANVVHKSGPETIDGNKTFTGNVRLLDDVLTIDSSNQAKHPVGMSLNNYYDDGVDGVAVLAFDDSNGDGNVILRFVHDPIESYDAATKGYVDDIVGDIETLLASI